MKGKSTHLVNVPDTSTNSTDSQLDYFNEHGDPVYAHMVNVKEINWEKASNSIPHQCRLQESEELDGTFQVSYCSAETWHGSWC